MRFDSSMIGIVVDFLTIPDAEQQRIYIPPRATSFNPSKTALWPVIEFVPSKHASSTLAERVLIPQMAVDVMNAM
jgi:hypothetical protein